MEVRVACEPAPDRPANEDCALHLGDLVAVFGGVTRPGGRYVQRLAARLAEAYTDDPRAGLPDLLATASAAVRGDHGAVCAVKYADDRLEYLVRGDNPLVLDLGVRVRVVRANGSGTVSTVGPDRVRRAALLTDGASAAVEVFGLCDWGGLLDILTNAGPGELIRRVRAAELAGGRNTRPGRGRHDDATAALCVIEEM